MSARSVPRQSLPEPGSLRGRRPHPTCVTALLVVIPPFPVAAASLDGSPSLRYSSVWLPNTIRHHYGSKVVQSMVRNHIQPLHRKSRCYCWICVMNRKGFLRFSSPTACVHLSAPPLSPDISNVTYSTARFFYRNEKASYVQTLTRPDGEHENVYFDGTITCPIHSGLVTLIFLVLGSPRVVIRRNSRVYNPFLFSYQLRRRGVLCPSSSTYSI